MLEFRDLIRIEAIVTQGGFTRAARALGMTQPALTRSIAAIEARLRGPLFRRSRRGAEPTPLCRTILADAPEILSRMQSLNDRLGRIRGGSGDELAIVSGPFPFETICLPAALAFRARNPRVRLRLESLAWPAALAQLRARMADVAVITAHEAPDLAEFLVEPLAPLPLVFVVRDGHALAASPRPSLAMALVHPLVTTAHLSTRLLTALAEARGNRHRADIAFPAVLTEPISAWARMVRESDCIALVTLPSVLAELERGELRVLRLRAPWLTTSPAIVRLASQPLTAAAEGFCAELREASARALRAGARLAP